MGVYQDNFLLGLAPAPRISINEWSDRYRMLPSESSAEPGRYRTDRMPYLEEIAYELSPQSDTERCTVMKGTQLGFTELANNLIFTYADLYPCPMLFVLPTETLAQTHAKDKIWPSVKATPRISDKIYPLKKDGGSSTLDVRFPGGNVKIGYSFSTSTFASVSRRVVVKDDLDRWPDDVKGEGNPSKLADKRTDAFTNKKIYANSSPTKKNTSKIFKEWLSSSQAVYEMPCPHCQGTFAFEKDLFVYEYDKEEYTLTSDVLCQCPHCEKMIEEAYKHEMMSLGEYVHTYPDKSHKGWRVPSYYSPFLSWKNIFEEYVDAMKNHDAGDSSDLIVWTNTRDAKVWDEVLEVTELDEILSLKVKKEEGEVPTNTAALAMSVDVQLDHFWFELRALQFGNSKHIMRAGRVENWTDLEDIFRTYYEDRDGAKYQVRAVAIDSGYRTDEVYEFCAMNSDICVPVKGVDTLSGPYTVGDVMKDKNGRSVATGLKLYRLNTKHYKDMLDASIKRSLNVSEDGNLESTDNVLSLHMQITENFAKQYTSEYLVEEVSKKSGKLKEFWKKRYTKAPNHLWDCGVYNTFLGDLLGIRFLRPEDIRKTTRKRKKTTPKPTNHMDEY